MIESFTLPIDNLLILANVIIMERSCWIWIGESNNQSFGHLQMSMSTKYEPLPLISTLIPPNPNYQVLSEDNANEDGVSVVSTRIARKLAKKLNIQVFINWNLEKLHQPEALEKKLFEILEPRFKASKL